MKRLVLLLGMFVCSCFPCFALTPSGCPRLFRLAHFSPWTWTDRNHKQHTRAELDSILENHKKWVNKYALYATVDGGISEPKAFEDPLRASLSGANLMYADLRDVDLSHADLSGANLFLVDFTHAVLYGANLTRSRSSR